jgi:methylated-DNA-[protein]-cysteine S-methyltransferase
MGQRAETSRIHGKSASPAALRADLAVFRTSLGWFALAGQAGAASRLWIGHASEVEVRRRLDAEGLRDLRDRDWNPDLRRQLVAYAAGQNVDFRNVAVEPEDWTPFQRRVYEALRRVAYGTTLSYAELAQLAGSPGAARAVGQAMARNRLPIIFPCHRVLASGGGLGGFSAPQGLDLKQRLLALEQQAAGHPPQRGDAIRLPLRGRTHGRA